MSQDIVHGLSQDIVDRPCSCGRMSDASDVTEDPNFRLLVVDFLSDAPRGAVTEFCRRYKISRSWFYKLRRIAVEEGTTAAIASGSRAPDRRPTATPPHIIDLLLAKRDELKADGWDHGPISVLARLDRQGFTGLPARATIARIFRKYGRVTPQPKKRPRASYKRFSWPRTNDMWQIDGVEHKLADGKKAVVIVVIDDCSRLALASHVSTGETSKAALSVVRTAIERYGAPQQFLSDNGRAFNVTRMNQIGQLTVYLRSLGVNCISSSTYSPETQGKNERLHATLQRFLDARPRPRTLEGLQALVDDFDHGYNTDRPHQALGGQTPAEAWADAPHAEPPDLPSEEPIIDTWVSSERVLDKRGSIGIEGTTYKVAAPFAQQSVIVMHNQAHVHIFDSNGTELTSFTKAAKGTRYVGNGRPRGFMARPETPTDHREVSTPDET